MDLGCIISSEMDRNAGFGVIEPWFDMWNGGFGLIEPCKIMLWHVAWRWFDNDLTNLDSSENDELSDTGGLTNDSPQSIVTCWSSGNADFTRNIWDKCLVYGWWVDGHDCCLAISCHFGPSEDGLRYPKNHPKSHMVDCPFHHLNGAGISPIDTPRLMVIQGGLRTGRHQHDLDM